MAIFSKIEKKNFHNVITVEKLSPRATFLSHRQDKVQVRPYPGVLWSKSDICKWGGVPKDASLRASSFGPLSRSHVTKGQAWACILEFGTPLSWRSDPQIAFPIVYACAKKFPPRLKNSLRGTPLKVSPGGMKIATLSSCSGRVFSAHMPIYGAMIDRWRNSRAQGSVLKNSFKNSFM